MKNTVMDQRGRRRRKRMVFLKLQVTLITCMLAATNALSASDSGAVPVLNIAENKCEQCCGKVRIPFPFGIGSNCFLNKWFEIFCNKSANPRPFLKYTQWEVLEIKDFYTEPHTEGIRYPQVFRINSPLSFFNCTDKNTKSKSLDITGTPFDFSSNSLVMSCGVAANIVSPSGKISSQPICSSSDRSSQVRNKTVCDGKNCFGTSTTDIHHDVLDISFNSTGTAENECKFAFMVDSDYWSDHINSSTTISGLMNYTPVIVNWHLNYEDIKNMFSTNMSKSASKDRFHFCDDESDGEDLHCYCIGSRGNPYLIDGCQDIDECKTKSEECGRWGTCVNTKGSYHCSYKRKFILIGVASSFGALSLLFGAWGLYKFIKKRKDIKRKQKFFKRNGGQLLHQKLCFVAGNVQKTRLFNSNELQKATDNFSIDRILGHGGQGTVYKGMLEDGKIVAIKKYKVVDEARLSDFINEVVILSQINHRNVVQLLGCCLETEVPLLVYEFIPNGTLFQYIHERNDEFPFTWKTRLRVATEVSGAVSYMHSAASFPIYHRDIKSSNILLDEKYRAKVADFGTSRTVSAEQTHLTTIVNGTFGYLDPEYFQSSQFTEKSDVYSFGVVLVELLTGQKAISLARSTEDKNLAAYFVMAMEAKSIFDIIDPQVLNDAPKEEIKTVANLAQRCLNFNGRNRPTMKEVAMVLEGIQRPKSAAHVAQQNPEELEYVRTEYMEPWDVVSTSTGSTSNKTTSTHTSKLQELSLLSNHTANFRSL